MMPHPYSRRQFIQKYFYAGLALMGLGFAACRGQEKNADVQAEAPEPASCDDLSGLTEEDLKLRETFGYVKESPVEENRCSNCNLWIPNQSDPHCGKCLLFKGPVYAVGHCTSWAPQL